MKFFNNTNFISWFNCLTKDKSYFRGTSGVVVSVFDLSKLTFTGRKPDVMTRGGVGFVLNVIRRGWMHPRAGVAL